eukprot:scaffold17060_cov84-Isochrysis_galbana.AAC.1
MTHPCGDGAARQGGLRGLGVHGEGGMGGGCRGFRWAWGFARQEWGMPSWGPHLHRLLHLRPGRLIPLPCDCLKPRLVRFRLGGRGVLGLHLQWKGVRGGVS